MLGKLLKHEFRATSRVFPLAYAAILVLAGVNRLLNLILPKNVIFNMISQFTLTILILMLVAVPFMTIFLIAQRFYKTTLGEEGYLSMTLPITPTQHILSKLITSTVWLIASAVVDILAILLLLPFDLIAGGFQSIFMLDQVTSAFIGMPAWLFFLLLSVLLLISIVYAIFTFYTAMCFGQLSSSHKLGCSVGAYFVIYFIVEAINLTMISIFLMPMMGGFEGMIDQLTRNGSLAPDVLQNAPPAILTLLLTLSALYLAYTVTCFLLSKHLLTKKLNLE